MRAHIRFLLLLGLANLSLLIPWLRPWGAVLVTLVLPGWGWAAFFPFTHIWPDRLTFSLAFSFAITTLTVLILHYLPGPIATWQLLLTVNLITLLPILKPAKNQTPTLPHPHPPALLPPCSPASLLPRPSASLHQLISSLAHPLTPILLLALILRFANLGYSEFQGDEALAMIFAAEAIEGHEDALFLRGKGPGEFLAPLALWRINGPISELLARVPLALAGLAGIGAIYMIARDFFSEKVALYSAGFFAASGFMVGFSRIVQYQAIVVWLSGLALWTLWRWRNDGGGRWAFASGLFVGTGLLAHYDAILILPALAWLVLTTPVEATDSEKARSTPALIHPFAVALTRVLPLWLAGCLGSSLPFYLPYLLDPQIRQTGSYVGDRIGGGLQNHLPAFLQFNSFYSSFYYPLLLGLLLVGFLAWAVQRSRWGRGWGPVVVAVAMIGLAVKPDMLGSWTIIPFGLILLGAFLSRGLTSPQRLALLWFAVPFLGYNFAVARPLTHIYTIIPGWALLAGWAMGQLRLKGPVLWGLNIGLALLSSLYLWHAFAQHEVPFVQDYPDSNLALFWTPYPTRPETGFFGFPHKTGWKAVGALLAEGVLSGDYDSNEEEDITSWYTRHTPRACDPGAEFYFIATDLIDPVPIPTELVAANYQPIGQTILPDGQTLTIQQQIPASLDLGTLDEGPLARKFDRTALPAAFSRAPGWQNDLGTNFGGQIQLLGYDLDTRRAYPGGRVLLTLYWQALLPLEQSYKVFVQLDPERKFAQADSMPVCARYPTDRWRPGQIIVDQHALHLSPETPLGPHPLAVGLYLPEDGRRLDILDVAGNPAGVSLTITEVEVREQ